MADQTPTRNAEHSQSEGEAVYLKGSIVDPQLWLRVLTAEEAQELYKTGHNQTLTEHYPLAPSVDMARSSVAWAWSRSIFSLTW